MSWGSMTAGETTGVVALFALVLGALVAAHFCPAEFEIDVFSCGSC